MRYLRAWIVRLFGISRQQQDDREFSEEIESHPAMHIEDNLRCGMNQEEARQNAQIKLGGIYPDIRCRRIRRMDWRS